MRLLTYGLVFLGISLVVFVNSQERRLFVHNSPLFWQVVELAKANPRVLEALGPFVVSGVVRGQRAGNTGVFEVDLCGKWAVGVLRGRGRLEAKTNLWVVEEARFEAGKQDLDLLKV
jgi:hypothetical protein